MITDDSSSNYGKATVKEEVHPSSQRLALRIRETVRNSLNELFCSLDDNGGSAGSFPHQCKTIFSDSTNSLDSSTAVSGYLPPISHDISFLNVSLFTPGCVVCQLQFKYVYRDYVIPRDVLQANIIGLGELVITQSHVDTSCIDLGVVTALYTVEHFLDMKRSMGCSQDEDENFVGAVLRAATQEEKDYLPIKFEVEKTVLLYARQCVDQLHLSMDVYEVEYQFDGRVLYVYYTADTRVDYRQLVAYMKAYTSVRVKMKKTNQCRKFVPRDFASVALTTGPCPLPSPHANLIDLSLFTPGCIVCQVQFKHVFRDYVVPREVLACGSIDLGCFLVTLSHLEPTSLDLGIVTTLYTVEQFIEQRQLLGRSQDEEENFVGIALRVATEIEKSYLPKKMEVEIPVLAYAQDTVRQLNLPMIVYEVEFQFDGRVLYVYYTADIRVDYRQLVAYMKAYTSVRVKMKKTNQCRKFVPRMFASVALSTGRLPESMVY